MTLPSRKNRLNQLNLHLTGLKDKVKNMNKTPNHNRDNSPKNIYNQNGQLYQRYPSHRQTNKVMSIYPNIT